jgi:hypothetical protein
VNVGQVPKLNSPPSYDAAEFFFWLLSESNTVSKRIFYIQTIICADCDNCWKIQGKDRADKTDKAD